MAHQTVEEAVEARLRDNWTNCAVFTENMETLVPSDGTSFLMLQFPVSDAERLGITNRLYRETGAFRIVIAIEAGSGPAKMREWGEELRDLFIDRVFEGVTTQVPSDPLTDDRSDRGPYFVGYMAVPYTFNFTA